MMRELARGSEWGEPGPSLEDEWLRLFGSPLKNFLAVGPAVSSGGLEGYYVTMSNGARIWYGGTNGWSIECDEQAPEKIVAAPSPGRYISLGG